MCPTLGYIICIRSFPNPISSASSFQYLDQSGITQEQLTGRLQFESEAKKFQHVVSAAMKSLMKWEVHDGMRVGVTPDDFADEYCYKHSINAETIQDVFLQFRDY